MTYILKPDWVDGRKSAVTSQQLRVQFDRETILRRVSDSGFRVTEQGGKIKSRLVIFAVEPRRASGATSGRVRIAVGRTAADLKRNIRRVRPEEESALSALDSKIEELQDQIRTLREERQALVDVAWGKAHVVRLKEIEELLAEEESTTTRASN